MKERSKLIYDEFFGHKLLREASKVVALSQVEAQQYERMGVRSEKIAVIPNGIELSEFAKLPPRGFFRQRFSIASNSKIILFLGRIHRIKGIDTLLESFNLLTKKGNTGCLLVIAGPDDGYLQHAQRMVSSLNLKGAVVFCGHLSFWEKLGAIVDSSVVILPSYYETFPNVVLESYACSRPVIASRVQAMEEIVIDGQTGLLFSPGNVEQLTNAISRMLNDGEWASSMGNRARELVEREYDENKVILRTEALYEEITGTPELITSSALERALPFDYGHRPCELTCAESVLSVNQ